tara:strand:+ start:456 stop:674 length:219 start_codon:yes stop_codon:yes gene_type:complete
METNKRKIGHLLKGPKRMEGETFEKYKIRRRAENQMVKQYLRGNFIPNNPPEKKTISLDQLKGVSNIKPKEG